MQYSMRNQHVVTMHVIAALLFFLPSCMFLSGAYVDPSVRQCDYIKLDQPNEPRRILVSVEFQTNGKRSTRGEATLREEVERVLVASKIFAPTSGQLDGQTERLDVVLNDVVEEGFGSIFGKALVTFLTAGLIGSQVHDGYLFHATYCPRQGDAVMKEYKHEIYTTVGLRSGPKGFEAMSDGDAFKRVIEDMTLNLLGDLQKQGALKAVD